MASSVLTTDQWVPPGVYLGRKSVPAPTTPSGSRKICLIGIGSRLQNILDTQIVRSMVYNEPETFTQVGSGSPATVSLYQATLQHRSNLDKTVSFLIDQNGQIVGPANWQYVEATDINGNGLGYSTQIELKASAYNRMSTYTLTYQSIDRDLLDPIPWYPPLEMRQFLYAGDQPGSFQYVEFQDFMITMNATPPYDLTTANDAVEYLTAEPMISLTYSPNWAGSSGPAFDIANEFTVDIANHKAGTYQITVDAVTASTSLAAGSVEYTVTFQANGTYFFTPVGQYTTVIPIIPPSGGVVTTVIDGQLTMELTIADAQGTPIHPSSLVNVVGVSGGNYFNFNVQPFGQLAYAPSFFDSGGRPKYTAKDTRTVDFTVASVIDKNGNTVIGVPTDIPDIINYTFTSSTQEGGYGVFSVTRPGTAGVGDGATVTITAPTKPTLTTQTSVGLGFLTSTSTLWLVLDRGQIQTVTFTGLPGVPAMSDVVTVLNTQFTLNNINASAAINAVDNTMLDISNKSPGGDHQLSIVGGTAVTVNCLNFSTTEAIGGDAILTTPTSGPLDGDFGQVFVGRDVIITGATTAINNGTFTIEKVTRSPNMTLTFRNDAAVTQAIPTTGNWEVTSPTPNYNNAPFRDGIVFVLNNPQNAVADQHTRLTITNEHTIDWSLVKSATENFDPTEVLTDALGLITGYAAANYVILSDVPEVSLTMPLTILNQSGGTIITITDPTSPYLKADSEGNLTAIVRIPSYNSVTDGTLTITYSSRGAEPSPGATYYFSASVLRPMTNYNSVVTLNDGDDAANFLAPSQVDNALYIGQEIAYNQVPKPGAIAIVQVYDSDQDGIYTNTDFKAAIQASFGDKTITDRIVLSNFGSILDTKTITIAANDPFVKKWALQWQGMPINAPIGSPTVSGSIVQTATSTLQVQGDNCGRGAFILIPNRWCKYTIQLNDGTQQQVTLDGSFLALAGAAQTAGFAQPRDSIIRQPVSGFDDIEVFSDSDLNIVGAASTCYIQAQGGGWEWGESVTVDTSEPALNEISGRTQEQFVSRYMVQQVDAALVGYIANSPEELASVTQSFVGDTLLSLRAQNYVADWQDDSGNPRPFDPTNDVTAQPDPGGDPRNTQFQYLFFLYYPGKRFFGLYAVTNQAFSQQTNS